ncbi:MAG: hypothetical protein H7Y12_14580 [Sphingobacteriaceae bacterium]|nr:hypothetical protein [Cytophagaceae bacterium]
MLTNLRLRPSRLVVLGIALASDGQTAIDFDEYNAIKKANNLPYTPNGRHA